MRKKRIPTSTHCCLKTTCDGGGVTIPIEDVTAQDFHIFWSRHTRITLIFSSPEMPTACIPLSLPRVNNLSGPPESNLNVRYLLKLTRNKVLNGLRDPAPPSPQAGGTLNLARSSEALASTGAHPVSIDPTIAIFLSRAVFSLPPPPPAYR